LEEQSTFPIIDFSDWEELKLPVSGVREKKWLKNTNTGELGLFKFPKTKDTGDFWAEKIADEIGKMINIETAKTELGIYNGRIGSFSYYILGEGEYLLEGHAVVGEVLDFSTSSEIYENLGRNYSVQLLEEVLAEQFPLFHKIIVFDCLIGNTDRHHGNWAFISDDSGVWLRLSPLYDNGSSLCYLERTERIDLMKNDKQMMNAALLTKPKSQIGLEDTRPANHFDVFSYICGKYKNDIKPIIENIERELTDETISILLDKFDETIICHKMKAFVKLFLITRRDKMLNIYKVSCEKGGLI